MFLKALLPRLALCVVLISGSLFALFESVYLHDQTSKVQFGAALIAQWMWAFRVIAGISAVAALLIALSFFRRFA